GRDAVSRRLRERGGVVGRNLAGAGGGVDDANASEGITSAKDPQQAGSSSAARDIILECGGLVGQLCIAVGYGIVYPGKVNNVIASVAASCDVQLVVDDSIRSAACRVRKLRVSGDVGTT